MSFILDALRKSELERQRQSGPSIAELPVARDDRRLPLALLAIGLLLAVNVGVLLYFMMRDTKVEAPAIKTAATAPASATAPVAIAPMPQPATPLPATAAQPEDTLASEVSPTVDATAPPPAPDPTLVPEAKVTYQIGRAHV